MIAGRRVLAVVPARGGSKGVPDKNLRPVCGIPIVALAGQVAGQVAEIDRAVVSTDSDRIAEVAKGAGLDAPFVRPPELSGDLIGDVDVLVHALTATEGVDRCRYDIVVMLQPTSPLRTASEVRECLQLFVARDADSVWSVSPADKKYHPLKQLSLQDGRLGYYDARGAGVIARQQLDQLYVRNGVAYVLSRSCLLDRRTLLGEKAFACVTTAPHISIDTVEDFAVAAREYERRARTRTPA